MLILNSNQVHYHRVVFQPSASPMDGYELKVMPGIIYHHKLYRSMQTFAAHQREDAIHAARQISHESQGQFSILVVEAPDNCTVWRHDSSLMLWQQYKSQYSLVETIDLKQVVTLMRNFGGVSIRDRRYKLKNYARCFVGSEAVAWLVRNLELSSDEAVQLGQRLVNEGWVHHVVDEHAFEDHQFFYRFYLDEEQFHERTSAS